MVDTVNLMQTKLNMLENVTPERKRGNDKKQRSTTQGCKLKFKSVAVELDIQPDCPEELIEEIKADAKTIQDRKGEKFQTAQTGNSYVILGEDTRVKYW